MSWAARGKARARVDATCRHGLELEQVVVRAVGSEERPRVLEVRELGLVSPHAPHGLVEPGRNQHSPVARRELVVLPLVHVAVVLEPLVLLPSHVDLDLS